MRSLQVEATASSVQELSFTQFMLLQASHIFNVTSEDWVKSILTCREFKFNERKRFLTNEESKYVTDLLTKNRDDADFAGIPIFCQVKTFSSCCTNLVTLLDDVCTLQKNGAGIPLSAKKTKKSQATEKSQRTPKLVALKEKAKLLQNDFLEKFKIDLQLSEEWSKCKAFLDTDEGKFKSEYILSKVDPFYADFEWDNLGKELNAIFERMPSSNDLNKDGNQVLPLSLWSTLAGLRAGLECNFRCALESFLPHPKEFSTSDATMSSGTGGTSNSDESVSELCSDVTKFLMNQTLDRLGKWAQYPAQDNYGHIDTKPSSASLEPNLKVRNILDKLALCCLNRLIYNQFLEAVRLLDSNENEATKAERETEVWRLLGLIIKVQFGRENELCDESIRRDELASAIRDRRQAEGLKNVVDLLERRASRLAIEKASREVGKALKDHQLEITRSRFHGTKKMDRSTLLFGHYCMEFIKSDPKVEDIEKFKSRMGTMRKSYRQRLVAFDGNFTNAVEELDKKMNGEGIGMRLKALFESGGDDGVAPTRGDMSASGDVSVSGNVSGPWRPW